MNDSRYGNARFTEEELSATYQIWLAHPELHANDDIGCVYNCSASCGKCPFNTQILGFGDGSDNLCGTLEEDLITYMLNNHLQPERFI